MAYTKTQRALIHRKAKAKLGILKQGDPQEHFDFIEQCMIDMLDQGDAGDDDEARQICEMMWEQEME